MKLPKHDQWILDYRDDPEAIERRIESLVDRRRMVRILVWTWTVIATVLAVLSVVAGGEPKFMAVGAYCLGMAAILFAGVHQCSAEIRTLALLYSECSGGGRGPS